jgi:hypothetical protein
MRPLTEAQLTAFLHQQQEQGVAGYWVGSGAARLGLTGPATPEQVAKVFRQLPSKEDDDRLIRKLLGRTRRRR